MKERGHSRAVQLKGQKNLHEFPCQRKLAMRLGSLFVFNSMPKLSLSGKTKKVVKLHWVCVSPVAFLERTEQYQIRTGVNVSHCIKIALLKT